VRRKLVRVVPEVQHQQYERANADDVQHEDAKHPRVPVLDVSSQILMGHSYRVIRRMRYGTDSTRELRAHLQNFVDAYNFARRLKTLKGLPPYEFICKAWTSDPHRFKISRSSKCRD
jgi:hypothetical protein